MSDDDRLAALRRDVATTYLGSAELASRLRGGSRRQLSEDALRLAAEGGLSGRSRGWATPQAALAEMRRSDLTRLRRVIR